MKILVTGGAGHIGSALVAKLMQKPDNIVFVIDNLSTGSLSNIPKAATRNLKFFNADINDPRAICTMMDKFYVDYIFHFAAVVGVARTQQNPLSVLDDIKGIQNVLECSKNTGVKRVFFASSSEVYGEPVSLPQHEHNTPLNSRLPYAVVKNVGEAYCRSYQKEYGLAYTIFRFFNTYGPCQSPDFVVSRFLEAALKNLDITIYGDGSQTRTFTYVDDTVDTCINCLYNDLHVNDVINIGNHVLCSVLDLAKTIIEITGSSSNIVHLPPLPDGDMTRRQPDNSQMLKVLGRPLIGLEDGLKRIINSRNILSC